MTISAKKAAPRAGIPLPAHMAHLRTDKRGFVVPWFVHKDEKGEPDFRIIRPGAIQYAVQWRRCFICGEPLGRYLTFPLGPMCSINRISAEPPSHKACAEYAVKVCPFLTQPRMRRNEHELGPVRSPAGIFLEHNPGVCVLWTCLGYTVERGPLFKVGKPVETEWWTQGRRANRAEVMAAIDRGLPALKELAGQEEPTAMLELERALAVALAFVPSE